MANSEIMKLSLLLELKNNASGGVRAFMKDLRDLDRQGKLTLKTLDKIREGLNKKLNAGSFSKSVIGDLKSVDKQVGTTLGNLEKLRNQVNKQLKKNNVPLLPAPRSQGGTDEAPRRRRKQEPAEAAPRKKDALMLPAPKSQDDDDRQPRRRPKKDPFEEPGPTRIQQMVDRGARFNDLYLEPIRQSRDVWRQQIESLRDYTDEAMKLLRAKEKFKLINLSDAENARAFKAVDDLVSSLGILSRSDAIETLGDLHTAFGDLNHAIEAFPSAAKYKFSMGALFGDKFSPDQIETQIQNSFKFLELSGKVARGREEMEKTFDTIVKISSATAGRVTGVDFLNMAKTAGPSIQNLTPEGLRNLSAVMQELGGQRTGTATMSMYQALVGGMMSQRSAERFKYFGLLDESKVEFGKAQQIKRLEPGANLLAPLMMQDPLAAADRLGEAFRAKGIDTNDAKAVNEQLATMFQNRTAQRLMSILMTQRGQVVKEAGLAEHAKGIESRATPEELAIENAAKFEVAMKNFRQQAGVPLVEALTSLSKVAIPIMQFFGDHPTVTKYGMAGLLAYKALSSLAETASNFKNAGTFVQGFFRNTNSSLDTFGDSITTSRRRVAGFTGEIESATTKAGGLGSKLRNIPTSVQVMLTLAAVGFTWEMIQWLMETSGKQKQLDLGVQSNSKDRYTLYKNTPVTERKPSETAHDELVGMQGGNQNLSKSLGAVPNTWTDTAANIGNYLMGRGTAGTLFADRMDRTDPQYKKWYEELRPAYEKKQTEKPLSWSEIVIPGLTGITRGPRAIGDRVQQDIAGANYFRKNAQSLADPSVMQAFRTQEMPKMNLSEEMRERMETMLRLAFPESFATSSQAIAQSMMQMQQPVTDVSHSFSQLSPAMQPVPQQFTDLGPPLSDAKAGLGDLYNAARPLPSPLTSLYGAAIAAKDGLDQLYAKIASWQPPAAAPAAPAAVVNPPGFAVGGTVTKSGLAYVHSREQIVPARAVQFRDKIATTLIQSLLAVRERDKTNSLTAVNIHLPASGQMNQQLNSLAVPSITPDSNEKGGVVTHPGLSFIHSNEEVTPSKTVAFRDTLSKQLVTTAIQMRERDREREREQQRIHSLKTIKSDASNVSVSALDHVRENFSTQAPSVFQFFDSRSVSRSSTDRSSFLNSSNRDYNTERFSTLERFSESFRPLQTFGERLTNAISIANNESRSSVGDVINSFRQQAGNDLAQSFYNKQISQAFGNGPENAFSFANTESRVSAGDVFNSIWQKTGDLLSQDFNNNRFNQSRSSNIVDIYSRNRSDEHSQSFYNQKNSPISNVAQFTNNKASSRFNNRSAENVLPAVAAPLAQGSRQSPNISISFGPTHFHFKGNAPAELKEEFASMLEDHKRMIVGMIRDEFEEGRARA